MASSSWLPIAADSPFSLANIPFGIISTPSNPSRRPAIAIGDHALDLQALTESGGFAGLPDFSPSDVFINQPTLNAFAALGQPAHARVRAHLQALLRADTPFPGLLRDDPGARGKCLVPLASATAHLPMAIGDYTDFYVGLNHAYNVGCLFRGPDNALQPNYLHLPVGYHGRASSVVVSGTPISRPRGQILLDPPPPSSNGPKTPTYTACRKLDFELELAAFVCRPTALGEPIGGGADEAAAHVFGYVLMNDWSARDVQAWEYVPLGPFTSKNFGTTVSAWVVLAGALEPFRCASGINRKAVETASYLRESRGDNMFDIRLSVELRPSGAGEGEGASEVLCRGNARDLLFSFPQLVAHHTVTGCNVNVGDLLASGTISGDKPGSLGSLLEASKNGKEAVKLGGGKWERMFLEDGDEVTIKGFAGTEGAYVGFGECKGVVLPALPL